jgi:nitrous oxidase accessory protein NosD
MRRIALVSTLSTSILLAARLAGAATHLVLPGPGTPIQDAIDAAAPGDTIRLVVGVYSEHLTIPKALKIRGVRSRSTDAAQVTYVAGACTPGPVITIAADDVQLKKISVTGDTEGGIDVQGRARIKLKDVFVASNCQR